MKQIEKAEYELHIKEERVAYWETYRRLPRGNELTEFIENIPLIL